MDITADKSMGNILVTLTATHHAKQSTTATRISKAQIF